MAKMLIDGVLAEKPKSGDGKFVRMGSGFRGWIEPKAEIADYPNLAPYLRELYQVPGVSDTIEMGPIRQHYLQSHTHINPHGIVSVGPETNLNQPHARDVAFPQA